MRGGPTASLWLEEEGQEKRAAQPHRMEFGSTLGWAGISFHPCLWMCAWKEAKGEGALPQTQHPSCQGVHLGSGLPASCPTSTCSLNRTASFPSRGRRGRSGVAAAAAADSCHLWEGGRIPRLCEVRAATSRPPLPGPPFKNCALLTGQAGRDHRRGRWTPIANPPKISGRVFFSLGENSLWGSSGLGEGANLPSSIQIQARDPGLGDVVGRALGLMVPWPLPIPGVLWTFAGTPH